MEEFLDKLKLLNYDDYFSKNLKIRPLNRHYFALQTNPGEQFFMFTSLAAWLFSKAGLSMEAPQESDDPNSLIATILDLTRQLNIPVDFPPNKLKQGYGPHVIYILDAVADRGLKQNKFNFKSNGVPPLHKDVPSVHKDVPSVRKDVPSVRKDVPSVHKDVPSIHKDVPSVLKDVPSVHKDVPSVHKDVPSVHKDVPSVHKTSL
ncbi:intraflagellar transport protein 57 homolog, partial [Diaphorina citri]|uniref:Intraflagellar transport protein 57 homolog n=1 Tax=Diaphorina citri TaxID=121845 RepID=A0A1S3DNZ0_DIACI